MQLEFTHGGPSSAAVKEKSHGTTKKPPRRKKVPSKLKDSDYIGAESLSAVVGIDNTHTLETFLSSQYTIRPTIQCTCSAFTTLLHVCLLIIQKCTPFSSACSSQHAGWD